MNHGKRINFTLKALEKLQPDPGRQTTIVWDRDSTGTLFGLRIGAGGKKTFFTQWWHGGKERKESAGTLDAAVQAGGIAGMRKRAAELRAELEATGLTAKQRRDQAAADAEAAKRAADAVMTVGRYFDERFMPQRDNRSKASDKRNFDNHARPAIGDRRLDEVTPGHMQDLHLAIKNAGKATMANRVVSLVGTVFTHAIKSGAIKENPVTGIGWAKEEARKRFLDFERELPHFNLALDQLADELIEERRMAIDVIRLLMLTGARSAEVRDMAWAEIDLERRLWTKPEARTKQKEEYSIPLSDTAIAILRENQTRRGNQRHVFKISPALLHKVMVEVVNPRMRSLIGDETVPPVQLHDLRRTATSYLSDNGFPIQYIARLVGHTLPAAFAMTERYSVSKDVSPLIPLVDALEEMVAVRHERVS